MRTKEIKLKERLTRGELCDWVYEKAVDFLHEEFTEMSYYDLHHEDAELEITTPSGGLIYVTMWNGGGGEVYVVTDNGDREEDFTNLKAMLARELPTAHDWDGVYNAWEDAKEEAEYWREEALRSYAY